MKEKVIEIKTESKLDKYLLPEEKAKIIEIRDNLSNMCKRFENINQGLSNYEKAHLSGMIKHQLKSFRSTLQDICFYHLEADAPRTTLNLMCTIDSFVSLEIDPLLIQLHGILKDKLSLSVKELDEHVVLCS